jgi:hypothetical protein
VEWLTVKKKAESERNRLFLIFLCYCHPQPGSNMHCMFALIKQKKVNLKIRRESF